MRKGDALREAKRWLRSLTSSEVKRLRDFKDDAERVALVQRSRGGTDESTPRGIGDVSKTVREATPSVLTEERPYSHPYYWAAFILLGDPG